MGFFFFFSLETIESWNWNIDQEEDRVEKIRIKEKVIGRSERKKLKLIS